MSQASISWIFVVQLIHCDPEVHLPYVILNPLRRAEEKRREEKLNSSFFSTGRLNQINNKFIFHPF
jgi:hypothetical protein